MCQQSTLQQPITELLFKAENLYYQSLSLKVCPKLLQSDKHMEELCEVTPLREWTCTVEKLGDSFQVELIPCKHKSQRNKLSKKKKHMGQSIGDRQLSK